MIFTLFFSSYFPAWILTPWSQRFFPTSPRFLVGIVPFWSPDPPQRSLQVPLTDPVRSSPPNSLVSSLQILHPPPCGPPESFLGLDPPEDPSLQISCTRLSPEISTSRSFLGIPSPVHGFPRSFPWITAHIDPSLQIPDTWFSAAHCPDRGVTSNLWKRWSGDT